MSLPTMLLEIALGQPSYDIAQITPTFTPTNATQFTTTTGGTGGQSNGWTVNSMPTGDFVPNYIKFIGAYTGAGAAPYGYAIKSLTANGKITCSYRVAFGALTHFGIIFRFQDASNYWRWDLNTGQIIVRQATVETVVYTPGAQPGGSFYQVHMEDNNLGFMINGKIVYTMSSTIFQTATAHGVFTNGTGANFRAFTFYPGLVWTNVASFMRGVSGGHGRKYDLEKFDVGQMTTIFNNQDGRFDPGFPSGPYFGQLAQGNQIRYRLQWSGVTYGMFRGNIEKIVPKFDPGNNYSDVTVTATDAMRGFNNTDIPDSYSSRILALNPDIYLPLDEINQAGLENLGTTGDASAVPQLLPTVITGTRVLSYQQASGGLGTADYGTRCGASGGTQQLLVGANTLATTHALQKYRDNFTCAFTFKAGATEIVASGNYSTLLQLPTFSIIDDNTFLIDSAGPGTLTLFAAASDTAPSISHYAGPGTSGIAFVRMKNGQLSFATYSVDGEYVDGTFDVPIGSLAGGRPVGNNAWGFGDSQGTVGIGQQSSDYIISDFFIVPFAMEQSDFEELISFPADSFASEAINVRMAEVPLSVAQWSPALVQMDVANSSTGVTSWDVGDAGSYIDALATSEYGEAFINGSGQFVFHNRQKRITQATGVITLGENAGGGEIPYTADSEITWDLEKLYSAIQVTNKSSVRVFTVSNTNFSKLIGTKVLGQEIDVHTDAEAFDRANYLLGKYAQIRPRIDNVVVYPQKGDIWASVLPREVSDRIKLNRRPNYYPTGYGLDCYIESVNFSWDLKLFKLTWDLSPADTNTYWILGTSALGSTTRLAF